MAILGTNPYTRAIPLVGGGYSVSTAPKGTSNAIKHSTVNVPKTSTYYKAPAKPKTTAVKTVSAPKVSASANYQTVQAPQAAPVAPAAPPPPSLDDLVNKYYSQSTGDVNSLYDKQKQTQLSQLKAQRDAAIGKINQQQTATKQDYYNQRNQADVVNAQNVQKLREIMAANGVSTSGENLTLNAQANSDRLNALNSLNQQEQAKMNDYASQITDWNNPARDEAITNQIEAARTQALLNAKQAAYNRAWNEFGFNNMSAAQQAQLAMSKYNLDSTNAANAQSSQSLLDYYNSLGFNSGSGGGGTKSTGQTAFNQNMQAAVARGVPSAWVPLMTQIVQRESSFNPSAQNPKSTAYGYAQFLADNVNAYNKQYGLDYRNNPVDQLVAMYHYIQNRYGTPQKALSFWNANKWY
jgi:hypothetical protein